MRASIIILLVFFIQSTFAQNPKREFRGVWVATVENIDWPSKPGIATRKQKKEIVEILDMHKKHGINAIVFQVRPAADAFYPSALEPWSRYLTGTPGQAPKPYYDPLQFWIEETHKRGMEFHAWCNPYRVAQKHEQPLAGNHVAFDHPEWIVKYGTKLYFNPGHPGAREFVTSVVKDIVGRYDVDAIHFDDYFYPYKIAGEEFPDSAIFNQFNPEEIVEIEDWRRHNVDVIIQMLSEEIKATKAWVKFGISPFGVWRNKKDDPNGSETSAGQTNYDHLYADILKWQKEGWIDYVTPQLYWRIGHPAVDFYTLCDWWDENAYGKHVYIGQGVYRIDPESEIESWCKPGEIETQIDYLRTKNNVKGSTFFTSHNFEGNLLGLKKSLQADYYKNPALPPHFDWLDQNKPAIPTVIKASWKRIKWEEDQSMNELNKVTRYVIYLNKKGEPFSKDNPELVHEVMFGQKFRFKKQGKHREIYEVRISALDRNNNESELTEAFEMKL